MFYRDCTILCLARTAQATQGFDVLDLTPDDHFARDCESPIRLNVPYVPVLAARKNRTNLVVFQLLFVSERMHVSPNDHGVRIFQDPLYMLDQEAVVCFLFSGWRRQDHTHLGVCMYHTPRALFAPLVWFVCASSS